MDAATPMNRATVRWERDLVFSATTPRGYELDFDADDEWGCMPVEALLMSLAGCMAVDVVKILGKMRHAPAAFTLDIEGERNATPPQWFRRVTMVLHVEGDSLDEEKVRRAVPLSEGKHCSVLHSLRPDMEIRTEIRLNGAPARER